MTDAIQPSEDLLTPEEAGQRLLEAVTLQAFRTNGVAGLRPVRIGRRLAFRTADVDGFLKHLEGRPGMFDFWMSQPTEFAAG